MKIIIISSKNYSVTPKDEKLQVARERGQISNDKIEVRDSRI